MLRASVRYELAFQAAAMVMALMTGLTVGASVGRQLARQDCKREVAAAHYAGCTLDRVYKPEGSQPVECYTCGDKVECVVPWWK